MFDYFKKISVNRQTLKTVGIYTFSNFLIKAVSFASLPLFTYFLTLKDFGILSIFTASISFFMPFVSLSILYSTSTDYFTMSKAKFTSFISTTFLMPLFVAFFGGLIFWFFFPFFKTNLGFTPFFIWALPVIVYCNFLLEQNLILIRNNNEPKLFFWLGIVKIIFELGLALLLILVFNYNWEGRALGIFFSLILCGFFAIGYLYKKGYLSFSIDFSIVKKELIYSLPVIITQFSIFCLSVSDRYFVNYYYGEERAGIYGLAATFASVILIFATALLQYLFPRIFSELSKSPSRNVIQNMFRNYTRLILLALAGLLVFTPLAYYFLISKKFIDGLTYFFLLAIANAIWCITYFFYSFLLFHKAKKKILIASLSAIVITLVLNNFLISWYQEIGAAISNICIYIIVFIIIFYTTRGFFYKTEVNEKIVQENI